LLFFANALQPLLTFITDLNKIMRKIGFIWLLLVTSVQVSVAQRAVSKQGNMLSVSDIHLNPFYDTSLMSQLTQADYTQWEAIFKKSANSAPSPYGQDSNYALFNSALQAMQNQNPSPDMIIITGDFFCHDFVSKFNAPGVKYPGTVQSFATKTTNFMAMMFNKYFPNTVILPVLGNNDSYCGDYKISPAGGFLPMFAKAWVPLQRNHSKTADNAFVRMFSKGGYYTFPLRDGSGGKAVLLNTVFFSTSYTDCNTPNGNPAKVELTWLKNVLAQSRIKKTKLWLVDHVPPGINVNPTVNGPPANCIQNTKLMWMQPFNDTFLQLLKTYHTQIKSDFSGHTHMDDFRVIYNGDVPVSFIHITPAISPLFYNNPGFESITYSKRSLDLINSKTYFLSMNTNAPNWALEYDFQKTYGVTAINTTTLNKVRKKIFADTVYRNKYITYYNAGNPSASGNISAGNWKGYWCGTGNLTVADFNRCYCNTPAK
jgi:sphingomyelin phosphodiesterase acid-like 3